MSTIEYRRWVVPVHFVVRAATHEDAEEIVFSFLNRPEVPEVIESFEVDEAHDLAGR